MVLFNFWRKNFSIPILLISSFQKSVHVLFSRILPVIWHSGQTISRLYGTIASLINKRRGSNSWPQLYHIFEFYPIATWFCCEINILEYNIFFQEIENGFYLVRHGIRSHDPNGSELHIPSCVHKMASMKTKKPDFAGLNTARTLI